MCGEGGGGLEQTNKLIIMSAIHKIQVKLKEKMRSEHGVEEEYRRTTKLDGK